MSPPSTTRRTPRSTHSGRPPGKPSVWRRYVERNGWRAYALPVLVALTIAALATTNPSTTFSHVKGALGDVPGSNGGTSGAPQAASTAQVKSDDPGSGSIGAVLPALQLPPGQPYSTTGDGTFATVPGTSAVIGTGRLHKFSIEVENGITGVDVQTFATTVMAALSNKQSWTADRRTSLQRVDSGPVDFHISLVSSMTVRALCGFDLPVETSCFDSTAGNRVVLNVARWTRGAKAYSSDLATYRLYAVNHEVGHALGHNHAHLCLSNGLAPVMMQQTIGTRTASGQICQPNPWPYPSGVKDVPGAEQAGDAADLDFYRRNSS